MEIRNDVAYILVRQWLARTDLRPVRVAKIRPPSDDDASQALIADELQIAGVGIWTQLATNIANSSSWSMLFLKESQ